MKAICVDERRELRLRDVPPPAAPPSGYVTVRVEAAAINPGDRTFLKAPAAAGGARGTRLQDVWGSSAAGVVIAVGTDVPARLMGRKVAVYRSLRPDQPFLGLWCETAQVPHLACLPMPDHVDARDYSGSLVNVVTAYAFLEQAMAEGHRGVLVTAGGSATGRAMVALAQRRGVPTLVVVRRAAAVAEAREAGATQVLASDDPDFVRQLEGAARDLATTAVFDGVGGALISRTIAVLPASSSVSFYGFLSGAEAVTFHSSVIMMRDLTMRRFSNFDSPTVRDEASLAQMLGYLERCIADASYRTRVGQAFDLSAHEEAMGYAAASSGKAVFLPFK